MEKQKDVVFFRLDTHFFSEHFLASLSSIMHQLCFCWMFQDVLCNFCTGKKKDPGSLSISVCVLCRGFTEQHKLTVDSFTLKMLPWQVYAR